MRSLLPLSGLMLLVGCDQASTAGDLTLERRPTAGEIVLAAPTDPVGASAAGVFIARVVSGVDTSYRVIDSAGRVQAEVAVPGIGLWLADAAGVFHTMTPGAQGVAALNPDGTAGPVLTFSASGIVRGVLVDSVDVVRLFADGLKVIRLATDGSGERELVGSATQGLAELLGAGRPGAKVISPNAALPSVTTTKDRVLVGNGNTYQIMIFDAAGQLVGEIARNLPSANPTPRQIEGEIAQILKSQQLSEAYLNTVRDQLRQSKVPFFAATQGMRYDGAGRLWVVGYDADSAFAEVFQDTTFVQRFPLPCPGFDGSWDLQGNWLAVACGPREVGASGGELLIYRILGAR
ncbi:MAG: hypothetical protein ACKVZ0_03450 [Gemmatimonadales bacterium]